MHDFSFVDMTSRGYSSCAYVEVCGNWIRLVRPLVSGPSDQLT